MKRHKCIACHKKQAYKKTISIRGAVTYECKYCGSKYIPLYHNTKEQPIQGKFRNKYNIVPGIKRKKKVA